MRWHFLKDTQKILTVFEYLIARRDPVKVRIEGEKRAYYSKFQEILPSGTASPDGGQTLVIDKLTPDRGNQSIQRFRETGMEFLLKEYVCRCHAEYQCISSTYPYYGHTLRIPSFLEMEEKREQARRNFERSETPSVLFHLDQGQGKGALYELDVVNCASQGLGLLVTEKEEVLLKEIKAGDRIPRIRLLWDSCVSELNGTVRHLTPIEHGEFKGNVMLGIETSQELGCFE
jgi:hypothetical protein